MSQRRRSDSSTGFTIVELIVCIVVIAILATIAAISYNSTRNKAKTATAMSQAQETKIKAEGYASTTGNTAYPTLAELTAATGIAQVPTEIKNMLSASAPTATTQATVLQYVRCTSVTGAKVGYWNSALPTPAVTYVLAGAATGATTATC